MLRVQAFDLQQVHVAAGSVKRCWWRLPALVLLFLISLVMSVMLRISAPQIDTQMIFWPITPFMLYWLCSFLPYLAACLLVLATPAPAGRGRWLELGIILIGALLLRAVLLSVPPNLSHDSWRYLWDARVTLYGFSPYVYAPGDPRFAALHDFLYNVTRFRNVPTIYPPGAQAVYLLSYLIAPSNLVALKGIFMGFEMVTCGALALLLARRGLDPARMIIYAWCPLPILEFAIQGHLDAMTLTFTVLALLCSTSLRPGMRVLTGLLVALATLSKIYPIVLLLVVMRRRDWALLATCLVTIALAYIPYLILGHGQVFGFFASYASENSANSGLVDQIIGRPLFASGLSAQVALILEYLIDILIMLAVATLVLWQRVRQRMSMEASLLLLIGAIFVVSSHIFPWYTTALLPWVAVLIGPVWTRAGGLQGRELAVTMAWYFPCISIIGYFFNTPDWSIYYLLAYGVTCLGLIVAMLVGRPRLPKASFS